ncbi:hypothetical protein BJ741DRAFT_653356 [Chytriomyces cf. hyalinus JEL632]|nr:hypothetical protein BJ741DRAFT_653356 [Chytriomyces cf. hyalinus JEL632]
MEAQVTELFSFLSDSREDLRKLAAENCAGISKSTDLQPLFGLNDGAAVKKLMEMIGDHPMIAHDAVTAMVNLSTNKDLIKHFNNDAFIASLVLSIIMPGSFLADLCCMLLNNLTKEEEIALKLVPEVDEKEEEEKFKLRMNPSLLAERLADATLTEGEKSESTSKKQRRRTPYLDNLLEVFVPVSETVQASSSSSDYVDEQPKAKPTYNFLAGVFANVSMAPGGAKALRSRSNVDNVIRLAKLLPFINHEGGWDSIRRGGCMSAVKNCCFDVQDETTGGLLLSAELNLVPYILLPLCGPNDFDDEDIDSLPEDLQLLEPTKTREPVVHFRLILVEVILLLTSSRPGRHHLRDLKVYNVVRALHLGEKDEEVIDRIERIVTMVMGDEEAENAAAAATEVAVTKAKKKPAVMQVEDDDSDVEEGPVIEEIV